MNDLVTVGMPLYLAGDIAWLALEGLARQENAGPWELIIIEEDEPPSTNDTRRVSEWIPALRKAGCVKLQRHAPIDGWTPLSEKWRLIIELADPSSKVLMLQGGDDYPAPHRIRVAREAIVDGGYDWLQQDHGHFLDVATGRHYGFRRLDGGTGLDMAASMALLRKDDEVLLPETQLAKGVDGWIAHFMEQAAGRPLNKHILQMDADSPAGLYTDGFNLCSTLRVVLWEQGKNHFCDPWRELDELAPPDVIAQLATLRGLARQQVLTRGPLEAQDLNAEIKQLTEFRDGLGEYLARVEKAE